MIYSEKHFIDTLFYRELQRNLKLRAIPGILCLTFFTPKLFINDYKFIYRSPWWKNLLEDFMTFVRTISVWRWGFIIKIVKIKTTSLSIGYDWWTISLNFKAPLHFLKKLLSIYCTYFKYSIGSSLWHMTNITKNLFKMVHDVIAIFLQREITRDHAMETNEYGLKKWRVNVCKFAVNLQTWVSHFPNGESYLQSFTPHFILF